MDSIRVDYGQRCAECPSSESLKEEGHLNWTITRQFSPPGKFRRGKYSRKIWVIYHVRGKRVETTSFVECPLPDL